MYCSKSFHRPGPSHCGFAICLVLLAVVAAGCDRQPDRKKTYPVTGQVYVDGEPAENLAVRANPVKGIDKADPTVSSAFTDADGRFAFSTFERGDGIPAGEYQLTFVWGQMNMFSMQYGGPDKLKDRYSDAAKSKVTVVVGDAESHDLGRIELTTK
jgi:5-hydroxyisourate hydrolase-like protein (transthyretin family)